MTRSELDKLLKSGPSKSELFQGTPLAFPADYRILVVDDISINCRILSQLLVLLGATSVRTALSGEDACRLAAEQPPSIVLMDLQMPGMNGPELLTRLRAGGLPSDVPVVGVTAEDRPERLFDVSGFHQIMSKPVTLQKLYDLFRGLLG